MGEAKPQVANDAPLVGPAPQRAAGALMTRRRRGSSSLAAPRAGRGRLPGPRCPLCLCVLRCRSLLTLQEVSEGDPRTPCRPQSLAARPAVLPAQL